MKNYPKISFIIPTLNAQKHFESCLNSIANQDYPGDKIEIIIADGGSQDKTLEIAEKFGARIYENSLKTAEAGKAVGVKKASGKYLCLIDSDNILPDNDWLEKMVLPLEENEDFLGSEPLYYTYRRYEDGFIDRYCALMGMNDPICFWIGSYDRMNVLSGTWTGLDIKQRDWGSYLELELEHGHIPTIGANGTIFRKSIFDKNQKLMNDYLFDMDILEEVTTTGPVKFAKVKVGIIHKYCNSSLRRFAKKQLRRVKDFLYRRSVKDVFITQNYEERKYKYGHNSSIKFAFSILKFVLSCVFMIPLIYQAVKGYIRKPDWAWFFHPVLCWITLLMYGFGTIQSLFKSEELSRKNW